MSIQNRKGQSGISRVLKQGSHFICGLCGTHYTQNAAAEACLRNCAAKLNPEGVSAAGGDQQQTYRCTYCKRTYEKFDEAKACAKTCHAKMQKKMETETKAKTVQVSEEKLRALSQLSGENLAAPPSAPKRQDAPNRTQTLSRPEEPSRSKAPPTPSERALRTKPETAPTKESAPPKKPASNAEELRPSQPEEAAEGENTVYTKEASKFRCIRCRKLHSSRKDVYACFESHDSAQQDSIEISLDSPVTKAPEEAPKRTREPRPPAEETNDLLAKDPNRLRSVAVKSEADKYFRDGARYGCRACKKKYFTKPEVVACFDSHGDDVMLEAENTPPSPAPPVSTSKGTAPTPQTSKESVSPAKEPATTANKAPAEKISNEQLVDAILESAMREIRPSGSASKDSAKEADEKFYRNGAKYVCKKCGAKYFTKDDVISCFDRHS